MLHCHRDIAAGVLPSAHQRAWEGILPLMLCLIYLCSHHVLCTLHQASLLCNPFVSFAHKSECQILIYERGAPNVKITLALPNACSAVCQASYQAVGSSKLHLLTKASMAQIAAGEHGVE